ncbi:hypothetical protein SDC9_64854 [bioreactor metagenome]|uniref:EamA domain-containing protein n=1 Tax=bioreactor metagenome TaxID=1076179 RepID=A0A644XVW5_9ZZZZ|nr:EamA family transporter [Candidatus Metalachnospira sp.]
MDIEKENIIESVSKVNEGSKINLSYFYIIAAALLWSTISIYTKKFTAAGFTEVEIISIRAYFSTFFLLIYNLLKNKDDLKLKSIWDIKYFIGTGVVSVIFFSWAYIRSINLSSAGVAATLLYTAPAIVMMFSVILFKERLTWQKIVIVIITFIGCLLVTGLLESGASVSKEGIFFGLCAGFGYAMYSIFSTFALKKYSSAAITFYTFLVATICLMPFFGSVMKKIFVTGFLPFSILYAFAVTILPYTLYTMGLSKTEASKASLMATVEPVGAALIGIFVFNEDVTFNKILGIALVAVSVVLSGRKAAN